MPTATITSKGQVTLPKKVREVLRVGSGDKIDFLIAADGAVSVRPSTRDAMALYGILHREAGPSLSVEEMDRGIAEAVVRKHRGKRR